MGFTANSQKIIFQYICSGKGNKVVVCADTTNHSNFDCQITKFIDTTIINTEYSEFINLCKSLVKDDVFDYFEIQLNAKQSFVSNTQLILRKKNEHQWTFNIDTMPAAQQYIVIEFEDKCKSFFKK
jgi:hypothetical protein